MPVGVHLDRQSTDTLGPFWESTLGNKYVLAVTDYFTEWMELFIIQDQSVVACARLFLMK